MDLVRGMDEHRLVEACLRGERKAQELLYRRYHGRMMGVCLRFARDRDEAAVILNTGFYKVFRNLDGYDPAKGKLDGWIYRIVLNAAIDHYRSQVKPMRSEPVEYAEHLAGGSEAAEIIGQLTAERILELVQRLSPGYRAVFNLYVVEGFTHPEIAERLGISEGTSKSNLAKARRRMQAMVLELGLPQTTRYAR